MKLGEMIQYLRKAKGYSQEEFAKILKIGRSTLANYEQCKRNPSYDTIEKIAKELDVNPAHLMGWEESANKNKIHNYISINPFDKKILYLSGIYQTYKKNEDICYKWYKKMSRTLKSQLQELEEMKFEFAIPFHDYNEEMDEYKDSFQEHIGYIESLIWDLEELFNTLDDMLYEDYDGNFICDSIEKKRKILLDSRPVFRDEQTIFNCYYLSLSDKEIEEEFNKLAEKLQHENNKFKKVIEETKQSANSKDVDIESKHKIDFLKMLEETNNKDKED